MQMKSKIQIAQELSSHIDNFNECYKDCSDGKLYASYDGIVNSEDMLEWLLANHWVINIVSEIEKSLKELDRSV